VKLEADDRRKLERALRVNSDREKKEIDELTAKVNRLTIPPVGPAPPTVAPAVPATATIDVPPVKKPPARRTAQHRRKPRRRRR
jgi:hypothetical protein